MTNRTSSYVMTIDPNAVSDWERVQSIRNALRVVNYSALRSGSSKRFRVSLRGRLGKNNPAYATKYKPQSKWGYRNSNIELADAQRVDVYVHQYTKWEHY